MKHNSFRSRRGFTLAEVLVVIGVIVIMLALGVPGFLGLHKNIQITKYDDIARQIYIAAQNELTRLSVGGMDEKTADALKNGTTMGETQPSDYNVEDAGVGWDNTAGNYKYATNGSDIAALLLPFGSVTDDVRSGHYVIEYNVETYVVYGVFYSEEKFDYATVSVTGGFRTDKSVRKSSDPMIGYYGGSAVERDTHCATPELTVDNGDELTLTISGVKQGYTVTVTIKDQIGNTATISTDDTSSLLTPSVDGSYTLVLDSLEEGSRFKEIFLESNDRYLTPGDDLDITVTFTSADALPSSATAQTNSLFATREDGDDATGDTVTITCARHLQNLDTDWSGLTDATVKTARQTEDINWTDATTQNFESITNTNLTSYNGNYQEIQNLTGSNGLFATTAEGMTLNAIRVVNPTITSTDTAPVGALIGTAGAGTTVEYCGVYCYSLDDDTINFKAYKNYYIKNSGTGATGGLIGKAEGTDESHITVTSSFAALPTLEAKKGGALIGDAKNCTISLSYASCDDLDTGLAYFLDGSGNTITKCYAVGNLAASENGSFASSNNDIQFSYYAVSHINYGPNAEETYLSNTEYAIYASDWSLKKDYTYQDFFDAVGDAVGKGSDGALDTFSDVTAPLTHPYREGLNGRAYPYPGFYMLEHYGSWPVGDGTVSVTILMKSTDSDSYCYNAGHVQVYELGTDENGKETETLLFDNKQETTTSYDGTYDDDGYKELSENSSYITLTFAPKTKIRIVVNEDGGNPDYAFTSITGLDGTRYDTTKVAEISGTTTVYVNFEPDTFTLTANWPTVKDNDTSTTKEETSYSVRYSTETNILTPYNSVPKVSTGSTVTITVNYPTGCTKDEYTPEVTYKTKDANGNITFTSEPLTEQDGKYTFTMPNADTEIDVCYVNNDDMVQVNVEYYVQGIDGSYPQTAGKTEQHYYQVAKDTINKSLAEKLSEASGKEVWEDDEPVLYYSYFQLYSKDNGLLASTKSTDTEAKDSYTFKESDKLTDSDTKPVTLKIYIARAQYALTLAVGEKIKSVTITDSNGNTKSVLAANDDSDTTVPTVEMTLYYGQTVTVSAVTEDADGQSFTAWKSSDSRFRQSSSREYTFTMPYYPLKLTASAEEGYKLVTLELTEDGESWLVGSDSRPEKDTVTLYLVDTQTGKEIALDSLTGQTNSYVAQAMVPTVDEVGRGYYILIRYKSGEEFYYTEGSGDYGAAGVYGNEGKITGTDNRVKLTVRSKSVTKTVKFFTVTYRVTENGYTGSVPTGGTYPANSTIQVQGNPGLLKYSDPKTHAQYYLIGWKDEDATTLSGEIYTEGKGYTVTGKTYFFAQWTNVGDVVIAYTYGEGLEDISGELPLSESMDDDKLYTIKKVSLTRPGYYLAGWTCSYDGCTTVHKAGTEIALQAGKALILTACWELEKYSVTYYSADGVTVYATERDYTIESTVTVEDYTAVAGENAENATDFIGWATKKYGSVRYSANETITGMTDDLNLYAVFATNKVRIYYYYDNDDEADAWQDVEYGVDTVLNPGKDGTWEVTSWCDNANRTGQGKLCVEDTAHTISKYSFTDANTKYNSETGYYEVSFYANTGAVFNAEQGTWYTTLYDAVVSGETVADDTTIGTDNVFPVSDNTLIIYRSMEESKRIEFTTSLYVIADGDRTVTWTDGTYTQDTTKMKTASTAIGENEFCGVMFVDTCKVTFGETGNANLADVSGTLTFDANTKSRVMALKGDGCEFKMVDGVTLTNGLVTGEVNQNARISKDDRQYMGGGVYAADGAYFNMAGGTISHCQATAGGGVYIVGTWKNNKWGKLLTFQTNTYEKSAKFSMGEMVQASEMKYSADKIYYTYNGDSYENVTTTVTAANYGDYYVTTGNPQIIYNTAEQNNNQDGGGGIVLLEVDSDSLNLFSGAISNNTATNLNGGGILLDVAENGQELRLYEVEISHNSATRGGGIFQYQGTTYIYNADILQNYADENGGGIYVTCASSYPGKQKESGSGVSSNDYWSGNHEISSVEFWYGTISGNQAVKYGGGIYLTAPDTTSAVSVTIKEGQILNNSAVDGGGIYIPGAGSVSTADEEKGLAVDIVNAAYTVEVTVEGGTIQGNSATNNGGGVYIANYGRFHLKGGDILNNSASNLGGGICANGSSVKFVLNGGYLSGNTAKINTDSTYKCDVYLGGAFTNYSNSYSYGWITTEQSSLADKLENDSGDPIYIMGYSGNTAANGYRVNGRVIIEYQTNVPAADIDCFSYTDGPGQYGTGEAEDKTGETKVPVYIKVAGANSKQLVLAQKDPDVTYTVEFNYNYIADGEEKAQSYSQTGKTNAKILYSDVKTKVGGKRDGYDLIGWAKTAEAELEDYLIYYQDGAVYMSYNATIGYWTYKYEGSTWYKWDGEDWNYKAEYSGGTWAWYNTKTGDTLNAEPEITGSDSTIDDVTSGGQPAYTITASYSQTLYAQWNVYTVTYDLGNAPSTVTMEKNKVNSSNKTVKLASPSPNTYITTVDKDGVKVTYQYTFLGWSETAGKTELGDDDHQAEKTITLSKSVTLYAVWKQEKYTITIDYEVNGGSVNDTTTHTEYPYYGQETKAWDNTVNGAQGAWTKSEQVLVGWATNSAGDVKYELGGTISAEETTSNMTLYAVWKDIVTVTFDNKNGSETSSISSYAGGTVTLPDAPTKDGCTFDGWEYGGNTYAKGALFTVPSDATGTITFTAQWKESADTGDTDTDDTDTGDTDTDDTGNDNNTNTNSENTANTGDSVTEETTEGTVTQEEVSGEETEETQAAEETTGESNEPDESTPEEDLSSQSEEDEEDDGGDEGTASDDPSETG